MCSSEQNNAMYEKKVISQNEREEESRQYDKKKKISRDKICLEHTLSKRILNCIY